MKFFYFICPSHVKQGLSDRVYPLSFSFFPFFSLLLFGMTVQSQLTPSIDRRTVSCMNSRERTQRRQESRNNYSTFNVSSDMGTMSSTTTVRLGQKRPNDHLRTSEPSGSRTHTFAELIPEKGAEPDWENNQGCFAYLQGNFQHGQSQYLVKVKPDHNNRVGYVIGRHEQKCDIV